MGYNFEKATKGKIGDIIYPAYNGTNGWFKQSRWELITKVDSNNNIMDVHYIYDFATVKSIELIREFPNIMIGFAFSEQTAVKKE